MKRFVTEYTGDDGQRYGGHVDADTFDEAQAICDARGRGETVQGVLHLAVKGDHLTPEKVDAMTRALAEEDPEPPDASEFEDMP